MVRLAIITGFAILLFAASDARAGLMTPDALAGEAAMSVDGGDHAAPTGPTHNDGASPDQKRLEQLAKQPAQGSTGASGFGTSLTHGISPAAMLALTSLAAAEPAGYCTELANSQLPQPPTSDLLRPPRHTA